jgi:hypothetical protein
MLSAKHAAKLFRVELERSYHWAGCLASCLAISMEVSVAHSPLLFATPQAVRNAPFGKELPDMERGLTESEARHESDSLRGGVVLE